MIYRNEHPKPQFMRNNWTNLNGEWDFEFDYSNSGEYKGFEKTDAVFSKKINVPFCVESKLSGIEYKDFINSVWYQRKVKISKMQLQNLVYLHFGAVDYETFVYVNGKLAGTHKGGYVSFYFDITEFLVEGENIITVNAKDDTRDGMIPTGKQAVEYESSGCNYTRTTGIWQTVWLEFVPKTHIENVRYYINIEKPSITIHANLKGAGLFKAVATYKGKEMGGSQIHSEGGNVVLSVELKEKHLWEVGNGRLYDLELIYEPDFNDNQSEINEKCMGNTEESREHDSEKNSDKSGDCVYSYFGLRDIRISGKKFLINEKSVFQRLILDQGFYPEGIYTAPSDAELENDILRSKAMGFNGARLHEKIFEERFLYYCDKHGYIVWGEYPNWGLDHSYAKSIYGILSEWIEEIERDFNHPSIVGWCPFNETWYQNGRRQFSQLLENIYKVTKAMDSTRPCIDTSGCYHVVTDVYDLHDYEQEPEIFASHYKELGKTNQLDFTNAFNLEQIHYDGKMPFFVSEYGGIGWSLSDDAWGYGNGPATEQEFLERLKGLTDVLMDNENMFGLCYTQLTDVEQEQNGLYTYDRRAKFDSEKIYSIFARKAAIED